MNDERRAVHECTGWCRRKQIAQERVMDEGMELGVRKQSGRGGDDEMERRRLGTESRKEKGKMETRACKPRRRSNAKAKQRTTQHSTAQHNAAQSSQAKVKTTRNIFQAAQILLPT